LSFPHPSGKWEEQSFVGIVTGNGQYVGSSGYVLPAEMSAVYARVFSAGNPPTLMNKYGTIPSNIFSGSPPRSEARVTYLAGTVTNPYGTGGSDYGFLDVSLRDRTVAQGRGDLTFTYSVRTIVKGPSSVMAGSSVSLSTTISNYRAPVTYKWWKNGTLMSGVTWPSFTTNGPSGGTTFTYKVEVTDADGDKGTGTHSVTGTSGGGGGGGGVCLVSGGDSDAGADDTTGMRSLDTLRIASALPCP
jgi:hypothetical protein